MNKAVVLLSGGQDSTTCLYWAKFHFDKIETISFNYGQRHRVELDSAKAIAVLADVPNKGVDLTLFGGALVNHEEKIEVSGGLNDLPTTFVPGRNLIMLSIAAAYAINIGADSVVGGMCQTDYSGYNDCRRETLDALEKTWALGMGKPVHLVTPLMYLTKAETVRLAARLPGCWKALAKTITCYYGKPKGCSEFDAMSASVCPACMLRYNGFKEAGFIDPATQEEPSDNPVRETN